MKQVSMTTTHSVASIVLVILFVAWHIVAWVIGKPIPETMSSQLAQFIGAYSGISALQKIGKRATHKPELQATPKAATPSSIEHKYDAGA